MSPIQHHFASLPDLDLHYVRADGPRADSPTVVLIHGWPQTWFEWRHLIPALNDQFQVIAPDMRGLGDSGRPASGYDKATVANDLHLLLHEQLGIESFHLVGHDWGGPTAFRLAAIKPEAVRTLTLMDVTVPGIGPDFSQGGARWHHGFHRTLDLPEFLIQGRERAYLEWFFREFSYNRGAIEETAIDEYVRCYSKPGAMRSGLAYYRTIPEDIAANQALAATGFKLTMPVLAMGGGARERRGRAEEPANSLAQIADDVTGRVVERAGHFIPEDRPEYVEQELRAHFAKR